MRRKKRWKGLERLERCVSAVSYTHLPAEDMNGDDYSYRALELQPDHPITGEQDLRILQTNGAIYNTAYKVAYSGEGTGNVTATNTVTFTALYAEKDWVGGETASVTLDLQYLTAEDDSKDANWKTLASVTLNGQADQTSGVYGEYEAWKARFTSIPSRMPGSYLEDADDWSCVTRYRIRERNSSGYVPIGEMKGTGEEGNPYLLSLIHICHLAGRHHLVCSRHLAGSHHLA